MALWQFQFYVVPKLNAKMMLNDSTLLSWREAKLPYINIEFLEKSVSWTDDIVQYGREDETCIQFFYEGGSLEEINCRLDLRSLSKSMLDNILNYVKEIDGMILYKNEIYPSNIDIVIELIKNSNANKFCKNPKSYFDELNY